VRDDESLLKINLSIFTGARYRDARGNVLGTRLQFRPVCEWQNQNCKFVPGQILLRVQRLIRCDKQIEPPLSLIEQLAI